MEPEPGLADPCSLFSAALDSLRFQWQPWHVGHLGICAHCDHLSCAWSPGLPVNMPMNLSEAALAPRVTSCFAARDPAAEPLRLGTVAPGLVPVELQSLRGTQLGRLISVMVPWFLYHKADVKTC